MTRKITITYFGPEKKEETISVDDARIYVSVLSKNQIQLHDRICFHLVPRDNVVMALVVEVHESHVSPPPAPADRIVVTPVSAPSKLPPPSWSRQDPPLVPLPRPVVQPSYQLPAPISIPAEIPVQVPQAAYAPSLFSQDNIPSVQTDVIVLDGEQMPISTSSSSSTSSLKAPRQSKVGRSIGYTSPMYVKNSSKKLLFLASYEEIKQLFEDGIHALTRPPTVRCPDERLCYSMFYHALQLILDSVKGYQLSRTRPAKARPIDSELKEFTQMLSEILFDFKVLDVAFMPRLTRGRRVDHKPGNKRQLNSDAVQAFSFLINYYTCFIDTKASKFDSFYTTVQDTFNATVDQRMRNAKQHGNADFANMYRHLPNVYRQTYIPCFNVSNAF